MKKIILLLAFISIVSSSLALTVVNEFSDLATLTTEKSVAFAKYFDDDTKLGGGMFIYYHEVNSGITNIAGYRIKLAGLETGYFQRSEGISNFNPEWCGAIYDNTPATLQSYGWTQQQADAMWGTSIDVTTDGYDQAALIYSFELAGTLTRHVVNFEPKYFYVTRTVELPAIFEHLVVNGNFAWIQSTNSTEYAIISRPQPANLAAAEQQLNAKMAWYNLNISATGSLQTCFQPGPSTSSQFYSLNTYNGLYGMVIEFTLDSKLVECENKNSINGFYIKNDDCSNCSNTNSNSNMTTVENCRAYQEGTGGIALQLDAIGGADVKHFTCEGTHYEYGIYVDGLNSTTTRGINIDNCWWECTTPSTDDVNEAFIYVRDMAAGVLNVTRTKGQYAKVMVNAGNSTGLLTVIVAQTQSWAPVGNFWFFNAGTCTWKINYNYQFDSGSSAIVPGTFSTNGGAIVPSESAYGNNTFQYIPR